MEMEIPLTPSSRKPGRSILGKEDWIAAALTMLVKEGIAAVEITRLANELTVSRGSFYWHFKDRGDLLAALIEEWRQLNSDSIRETLSNADNLEDGILGLFTVWVSMEPFNAKLIKLCVIGQGYPKPSRVQLNKKMKAGSARSRAFSKTGAIQIQKPLSALVSSISLRCLIIRSA